MTHKWTLAKSVSPNDQVGFAGDGFAYTFTVKVGESSSESNFSVKGKISVTNPSTIPMTVSLADVLSDATAGAISGCTGGTWDGTAKTVAVAAGATAVCDYSATPADRSATSNKATATLNSLGYSGSASVAWTDNQINPSVTYTDSPYTAPVVLTAGQDFSYAKQYTCSSNTTDYTANTYKFSDLNTATLSGGATDSKSATENITCYIPVVSKTAAGTYDHKVTWTITKAVVGPTSQDVNAGTAVTFTYKVSVTPTITDSNFSVKGVITVSNPNPVGALTVALSDKLSSGETATIGTCTGGTFSAGSLTVPAGGTAVCAYTVTPASAAGGTNTATATLNGIDFTGSKAYTFTVNDLGIDPINVYDSFNGGASDFLFTATSTDSSTWSKTYTRVIQTSGKGCGPTDYPNTASIKETGAIATAKVTINVVGCAQILPTNTTCQDYLAGTTAPEPGIFYSVKSGLVSQASPGVVFYYMAITAPSANFTFHVEQSTSPAFTLFGVRSVNVYGGNSCNIFGGAAVQTGSTPADQIVKMTGATAGQTYVIQVKYIPNAIVGSTAPAGNVTYNFDTRLDGVGTPVSGSQASIVLCKK